MDDLRRQEVRELARLTVDLSAAQQTFFQAAYGRHHRNPTTAFVLCVLLGAFGAHYFYFGRARGGILRLLFCWTLVPLVMSWFEARTMATRAMRYNASLASELMLALTVATQERAGRVAAASAADAMANARITSPLPQKVAATATAPARDPVMDTAEADLIAAAYLGREASPDDPGDPPITLEELAPFAPAAVAITANGTHSAAGEASAANGHTPTGNGWQPDTANEAHPLSLPEFETAARATINSNPVSPMSWSAEHDWHGSSLGALDAPIAPADPFVGASEPRPAIPYADDALDDADLEQRPWLTNDARPAVAAAASAAAAAWEGRDTGALDNDTREYGDREYGAGSTDRYVDAGREDPVFMYQVAAQPRREPVRYGPMTSPDVTDSDESGLVDTPPARPSDVSRAHTEPLAKTSSRPLAEDVGLAVLGSALASGLADLLRERPARPRSRPLSQPVSGFAAPAPASASVPKPPEPAWATEQPAPAMELTYREEPARAENDHAAAIWTPEWSFTPMADASADAATPAAMATDTEEPGSSLEDYAVEPGPMPTTDLHQPENGIRESTSMSPTAAYMSTPSLKMRRRVVQRVIVRKMAVLEGRVVAESTVERQVPVVADEAEMAERIQDATTEAAREALQHLLQSAPEDALPAIRAQLDALDNDASTQGADADADETYAPHW